jgi:hypothetical protein
MSKKTKRDYNVLAEARQEISLATKTIKSKKLYTRKPKHKGLKDV